MPLYAIALVLGVVAMISWVVLGLTAGSVAGKASLDPEHRFGQRGRDVVAAALGLGLGGMSASFAGWPASLAVVGAVAGGVGAVVVGRYLGVEEDPAGDGN